MELDNNTETTPPRPRRLVRPLTNIAVLLITTLTVIAIGEALFRYRFDSGGYHPPEAVLQIQKHLVTHPDYGFAWRPNVDESAQIIFNVADVEFLPLSTDAQGFINHPKATTNRNIDILGLGDSFVEHAAHTWFKLAKDRDLNYYSLALHRTAPPQYAEVFKAHGKTLNPKWIVIGLFENDFVETSDFYQWKATDLDWFEYHSGIWCGPPVDNSFAGKLREGAFQGWNAAIKNTRANLRGQRMSITGPTQDEIAEVIAALRKIFNDASAIQAHTLLVLIPSKPTATNAPTKESKAYDMVVEALPENDAIDVLDLRPIFRDHPNPSSLYYEVDGHWNQIGMELAGKMMLNHIAR